MLFSYNWLNDYLEYKVSPQDVAHLLTMHAFEVESLKQKGNDWLLDISVLPNRASDALCHQGMAREINAIAGFKGNFFKKEASHQTTLDQARQWLAGLPTHNDFKVIVEKPGDCPLYYALAIEGVEVGKSPDWLKEKLEAAGQDSINNLVDISNFVMLETQQPTHIFDAACIEGNTLKVRRARKREKIELLGGTGANLTPEDLVIADTKKTLAIAGIKGGKSSGVSEKTRDIIIEVAHFNPERVYRTASSLCIATDSAKRFSAGLSIDLSIVALHRITNLINELAGGRIVGLAAFQSREASAKRPPIIIDIERIHKLMGVSLETETIKALLGRLGFSFMLESPGVGKVTAPYWRIDCNIPEDIAEEVVRLYGLDAIPPKAPEIELGAIIYEDAPQWRSFARRYFINQGFDEVYNYSFVSQSQARDTRLVPLAHPISVEKAYLRDSLLEGLLLNIEKNEGLFPTIKLFEVGNVFWQEKKCVYEEEHLAGAMFNKKSLDFREMRGFVEGFLEAAGFDTDDYVLEPSSKKDDSPFLMLSLAGKECGSIYIPSLPWRGKIKGHIVAFELRSGVFYKAIANEREFQVPPRFPAVIRDVSLVLPRDVKGDTVIQIIHEIGKDLIEDVDLFDVYQELESANKNFAFHIVYRCDTKTLTDDEVNDLQARIEQALMVRLHAKIR